MLGEARQELEEHERFVEEPASLSTPSAGPVSAANGVNTVTAVAPTQPYGWGSSRKLKRSAKITNDLIVASVLFP